MKVVCDFCGKDEALVFCCADEAALCDVCDRRVHWANKLAGKHRRFSLNFPSDQSHPVCDICKEKRAFLFCQEDRAVLCRDCDDPIHSANHLTRKHNRFLLTGIRFSAAPISAPEIEIGEAANDMDNTMMAKRVQNKTLMVDATAAIASPNTIASAVVASGTSNNSVAESFSTIITSAGSISEYLIKMCPGWHVEDLLVDDMAAAAMDGFSEVDELLPFLEGDLDGGGLEAICAPHVPQFHPPGPPAGGGPAHHQHWLGGKEVGINFQQGVTSGRERWRDDAFMVPQISNVPTASPSSKRPRHSVWYH